MQNSIYEFDRPYDHARDGCFLPELLAPEPEKIYWAKIKKMGNRQYEVNVCRPFNLHGDRRTDGPKRIKTRTEAEQRVAEDESLQRSIRRSRQGIRHLVKCLGADHMLTLNYRKNMQSVILLKRHFKEFCRLVHVRFPDWRYVAVREFQDRGALHLHLAVRGRQPIKWLLKCWLQAIGQPHEDINDWYIRKIPLGEKSLGAVNVRAPQKRFGTKVQEWHPDKLAGYITKYIHKDFEQLARSKKRYWASRDIEKPEIIRLWLGATSFAEALNESVALVNAQAVEVMKIFADQETGNIWISASGSASHNVALRLPCPF